jgi:hypothetical protein
MRAAAEATVSWQRSWSMRRWNQDRCKEARLLCKNGGHGSFHAQSWSDVIDVIDTRSFEVKRKVTFDIRQPCYSHALEKQKKKHVSSIDAR